MKKKSFLKWAGNKYHCLDNILSNLPRGQRLIEPFTGSAVVFMNANFEDNILAENNPDLVNLYKLIQQEGREFIAYCAQFFNGDNNNEHKYYQLREEFNYCLDKSRRAALFLYLNRHGYNGLCRYNSRGIFNVPFGRYKRPYFPSAELLFFHEQGHRAQFILSDFRNTFHQAKAGDVIYCDPPYVPLSASANFASYSPRKFTIQDQLDLAALARDAATKGVSVLISNHDTAFTREQYADSRIESFPVSRRISCLAQNRHKVQELIAVFSG